MKIAVVGAGAVGLFYGGHLAKAGKNVWFLARRGLEELKARGLRIVSREGGFELPRVCCVGTADELGAADLIVIAIKATENAALEKIVPPLLKPNSLLLTLQNGLGNEEFLSERWGKHRVLGATCFVCLRRLDWVTVQHDGFGRLGIGEYSGGMAGAADMVARIFQESGLEALAVENLAAERWRKLVWNVPFNGLSVVAGGVSVDVLLGQPHLLSRVRKLMEEVMAIAAAEGTLMAPGLCDQLIENTRAMGAYLPSTAQDWREGRAMELEAIWAEPLRRAALRGIATPNLARLHEELMAVCRPASP